MNKSLYLFVTSERPDPYINSIIHCFKYKKISKAVLLYIDDNYNPDNDVSQAHQISLHIHSLLNSLATRGVYIHLPDNPSKSDIDLATIYGERLETIKQIYQECRRKIIIAPPDDKDIPYLELRQRITTIHRREPDSIFDVTAVGKDRLGDIFATILTERIGNLHTFNLLKKPNFDEPWINLIHDLTLDKDYNYVNILDTPIYRECSNLIQVEKIESNPVTSPSNKELEVALAEVREKQRSLEVEQEEKLKQARGWYRASLIASGVALALVFITVLSIIISPSIETTGVSVILTAITTFLTNVFFQRSDKANKRADMELDRLNQTHDLYRRIQVYLQIIEGIDGNTKKDKLRSELLKEVYENSQS